MKMKLKSKIALLICLFFLTGIATQAQVSSDWDKDTRILREIAEINTGFPIDSVIWISALYFTDSPYVASTLEGEKEETLIVNLRQFDCTTFVENCLALSRCMQYPNPDMDYFERILRQIRYRNGHIDGYTSRLHYTSDWIYDNVRKGILEDITHALGGHRYKPKVFFMSKNTDRYPALKKDAEEMKKMREIESGINSRNNYFYIPQKEILERQSRIKNGDIICFTTSVPGLDISHIGIAYWYKNQLTFVHASSKEKKVIINPESLTDYCEKIKTNTGIIVLRANNFISDKL